MGHACLCDNWNETIANVRIGCRICTAKIVASRLLRFEVSFDFELFFDVMGGAFRKLV